MKYKIKIQLTYDFSKHIISSHIHWLSEYKKNIKKMSHTNITQLYPPFFRLRLEELAADQSS